MRIKNNSTSHPAAAEFIKIVRIPTNRGPVKILEIRLDPPFATSIDFTGIFPK